MEGSETSVREAVTGSTGRPKRQRAATTSTSNPNRVSETIHLFASLLRSIPPDTRAVMISRIRRAAPTYCTAVVSMPKRWKRYPAQPRTAVAADADFAVRNIHPAENPHHEPRVRYPYS